MTRRPSMQFYPGDFLAGTALMSRPAVGAYITMLCYAWEHGPIPDTKMALFKAMGLGPDDAFDALWAEVQTKWSLGDAGWTNHRLEKVRADRDQYVAEQRRKGLLGGRPSKAAEKPELSENKSRGFPKQKPERKPRRKPGGKPNHKPGETPPSPSPSPISDLQSPEKELASTPCPPARPTAPTKVMLTRFDGLHRHHTGKPAVINGGKDGKTLAGLWRSHGQDEVERAMALFFASTDPFIRRAGFTVGVFASQFGKLILAGGADATAAAFDDYAAKLDARRPA